MIRHQQHILKNGIKIVINEDFHSNHIAVCYFFDAGSKYDAIGKSGSAHLLEHVLYTGTDRFPDYDDYLQVAGGDGNAFTNQDIACYYTLIPRQNFRPFLELEADRFTQTQFDSQSFETQKKVVLEEFKETCMTEPYGDLWHHIGEMVYKDTPYEWPPIGQDLSSILSISLRDLESFFKSYYVGGRITIGISGPVKFDLVVKEMERLLHPIAMNGTEKPLKFPQARLKGGQKEVKSNVPVHQLFLAFPGADRLSKSYLIDELIIEIFGAEGSGFIDRLIRHNRIVNDFDIYHTEHLNRGLVILEARPTEGGSIDQLSHRLHQEINQFMDRSFNHDHLTAALNRIESQIVFSKLNVLNKAMQLGYFGWLEQLDWMSRELELYQTISLDQVKERVAMLFSENLQFELRYMA